MSAGAPALEIVAAVAANGVIGRDGQLPWRLPDDLKQFKALTLGHAIIMGRRTFESIGRALPGRRSIVVSTTLVEPPAGVELARSLEDALGRVKAAGERAFVIGGAALYAAAIPLARVMHLTEIDEAVEGDVFFPSFDKWQWKLAGELRHERDDRHALAFRFCTYERLRSGAMA
jgi:dihydrofolate reductase